MKPIVKLSINIPAAIIEILQSKDECKTAFQLNKYVFFSAVLYAATDNSKELNSHDLYATMMVNNVKGMVIKNNLIKWGIIEITSTVQFKKAGKNSFSANNSCTYRLNPVFIGCITTYTFFSSTAKFVTKPEVYWLTGGEIIEKATEKEVKELAMRKKALKRTVDPKNADVLAVATKDDFFINHNDVDIDLTDPFWSDDHCTKAITAIPSVLPKSSTDQDAILKLSSTCSDIKELTLIDDEGITTTVHNFHDYRETAPNGLPSMINKQLSSLYKQTNYHIVTIGDWKNDKTLKFSKEIITCNSYQLTFLEAV
ncbi:hypothetical protein [Pedobacter miscanthi]|uniref:Uncharacterized protein n=1 Tax=Pedobacter miscanthi TaxID=2259170 RepID=A0A366KPU9_9SPHI|nr:hypothetical protein [Pedobacter miscanthi]RBQ02812.1 hypothetical protein DRW42_24490 [Pedobacter miscanthi]